MSKKKSLGDYAEYTARVRKYAREMDTEAAVEKAITECINEGILADFLRRNRAEAKKVSIYEYDEQQHMDFVREEGMEEGLQKGIQEGLQKGIQEGLQEGLQKGAKAFIETLSELDLDRGAVSDKLVEKFAVSREEAEELLEKYWPKCLVFPT